jgi:hypothetical protein
MRRIARRKSEIPLVKGSEVGLEGVVECKLKYLTTHVLYL